MVHHCISVHSHSLVPASVDHLPELLGGTHAGLQFVADWLIEPVPRVQLSIFWVLEVQNGLGRRENLHTQVTCLSDHLALISDVIIGPAKHLNDRSLLPVLVITGLVDRRMVPNEIHIIQPQLSSFCAPVKSLYPDTQQVFEAIADEESIRIRSSIPKVILERQRAELRVDSCDYCQISASSCVGASDVTNKDVVILITLAPERVTPWRGLKGTIAPRSIIVSLLPSARILVIIVVTRVPEEGVGERLNHHCRAQQDNQALDFHLHLNYKQSYQARSLFMSSKVGAYLGRLQKMGKMAIIQEAKKLGVRIKHKSTREESLRVLEGVQHRVIEEYLNREAQQRRQDVSFASLQAQTERVKPVITEELHRLRIKLLEIDRIHLNQYNQRYYESKGGREHQCQDYQGNAVDRLLGIRTQIFINPKEIRHEHQYPFAQLQKEIFPTIIQNQGLKQTKAKSIGKFYDPSLSLKDNLLFSYGLKKERQFNNTHESLESLIFRKISRVYASTLPHLLTATHQYGSYYAETMAGLQTRNLAIFIRNFNEHMDKARPKMMSRNYLCLTLAEGMLRSEHLLHAIEKGSENGRYVLTWIYRELTAFIENIEAPDHFKQLDQTFLKTLKKYNLIKLHLLNSPFSAEVPEGVLVGTENKEWPEKMLVKLEESVQEVGVGDFGGRRVVDRLAHVKEVIEFVAEEGLELSASFLEKLLLSVRSGLDWLQHEKLAHPFIPDQCLVWQLQTFNSLAFSKSLIKIMFLGVPTKEDRVILHFLWHTFLHLSQLHQSTIQHLFLLINITIRSRQESLLQDQREKLYYILQCSIETIFTGDLSSLKSQKIMNFIREEGTVLLEAPQKQSILAHLQLKLQQPSK